MIYIISSDGMAFHHFPPSAECMKMRILVEVYRSLSKRQDAYS